MPTITTLLFDCDNTLVLSESLAFEACAELANEILASRGIKDRYTGPQLLADFVGQNFRGMLSSLKAKYNYSMSDEELETYVRKEEDKVIAKLKEKLQPCEGVDVVLANLHEKGSYDMAVVSSSALRRVQASIEKVGQDKYFPRRGRGQHASSNSNGVNGVNGNSVNGNGETATLLPVFSAASSLPKPTSKPDPAIYLFAMEQLGKVADECVAVEDSRSGATAAHRAGIKTIGYTGSYEPEEVAKMEKVLTEAGCDILMHRWSEFDGCLAKIEKGEV